MAMDLPARHDKSSLNCRPDMLLFCGVPTSMISVAAEAVVLVDMIVPRRAMYGTFFLPSRERYHISLLYK